MLVQQPVPQPVPSVVLQGGNTETKDRQAQINNIAAGETVSEMWYGQACYSLPRA
jgi:hypothetical protein